MSNALDEEVQALMRDERIVSMAGELCSKAIVRGLDPIKVMQNEYEEFMRIAYTTYRARGGTVDCSVGSPGEAVYAVSVVMRNIAMNLNEHLREWREEIDNDNE